MSDTVSTADQTMREAIASWVTEHNQESVMVLRYAVVAEVINSDGSGEEWLKILANSGLSTWTHLGMVEAHAEAVRDDLRGNFIEDQEDDQKATP